MSDFFNNNMKKIIFIAVLLALKPLAARAETIDSMDDGISLWTSGISVDTGAVLTPSSVVGYSGNALKFDYTFNAGQWVEAGKDFGYRDFSGADQIRFYCKGSGASNNLQVQLTDADGSVFAKTITAASRITGWKEIALTFSGSSPDLAYSYGGDSTLDTTKISALSFGVSRSTGGAGTIAVDDVRLYVSNPANIIMNNFNDLDPINSFGGDSGIFTHDSSGTCTTVYVTTTVYEGLGAIELTYNVSKNSEWWCGYWTNLENKDVSAASHLSLKVKGGIGGEKFQIQLRGYAAKVRISDYMTVSDSWQVVNIPLTDFAGFVSTGAAGSLYDAQDQLCFVFENSLGYPTSGVVYIDDIRFVTPGAEDSLSGSVDNMDEAPATVGKWRTYGQVSGALTSIAGISGGNSDRCLEMAYNIIPDSPLSEQWAVMSRTMNPNAATGIMFRFKYKGSGSRDNIEFKVSDSDGNVYRKILYQAAETNDAWKTAEIPFDELTYFSGNRQLDLTRLRRIWIAVSKSPVSDGSGSLVIDELEYATPVASNYGGGSILEKLEVPYNPISPNGDGKKDTAWFTYKLKEAGAVELKVFTLKGENIYSYEKQDIADGDEHTIQWNAKNNDNTLVSNGLYIYTFNVKGSGGREDKVTHILGVVR